MFSELYVELSRNCFFWIGPGCRNQCGCMSQKNHRFPGNPSVRVGARRCLLGPFARGAAEAKGRKAPLLREIPKKGITLGHLFI